MRSVALVTTASVLTHRPERNLYPCADRAAVPVASRRSRRGNGLRARVHAQRSERRLEHAHAHRDGRTRSIHGEAYEHIGSCLCRVPIRRGNSHNAERLQHWGTPRCSSDPGILFVSGRFGGVNARTGELDGRVGHHSGAEDAAVCHFEPKFRRRRAIARFRRDDDPASGGIGRARDTGRRYGCERRRKRIHGDTSHSRRWQRLPVGREAVLAQQCDDLCVTAVGAIRKTPMVSPGVIRVLCFDPPHLSSIARCNRNVDALPATCLTDVLAVGNRNAEGDDGNSGMIEDEKDVTRTRAVRLLGRPDDGVSRRGDEVILRVGEVRRGARKNGEYEKAHERPNRVNTAWRRRRHATYLSNDAPVRLLRCVR